MRILCFSVLIDAYDDEDEIKSITENKYIIVMSRSQLEKSKSLIRDTWLVPF
jgi:hypothetical protein